MSSDDPGMTGFRVHREAVDIGSWSSVPEPAAANATASPTAAGAKTAVDRAGMPDN